MSATVRLIVPFSDDYDDHHAVMLIVSGTERPGENLENIIL
jgi:hypothetical protein